MGKKLLIIGNGFDLAHGLPTKYSDFLEFALRFMCIYTFADKATAYQDYTEMHIENWNGNEAIKAQLKTIFKNRRVVKNVIEGRLEVSISLEDELLDLCKSDLENNIWYDYFVAIYKEGKIRGRNWIDFEMEISNIIQWIETNYKDIDEKYNVLHELMSKSEKSNEKMILFYQAADFKNVEGVITVEDFINKLYCDLERLTRALGVYLNKFVESISVEKIDLVNEIKPDYVISFNYTNTYERVYCHNLDIPICYIHGNLENLKKDTNMVLGIDEYLDSYHKNIDTDMAIFKKFIQRIRKKNDITYRKWYREMQEIGNRQNSISEHAVNSSYFSKGYSTVCVYGHSLDVTDKDILELFLKPDFFKIEVFAKGKMSEGKLLSNLIKIVGEDTIIEKANDNPIRLETYII